ncbi:type VI secretion system protein ImpH [Luteibacter sp. Sphag1AF]|uniref:type VI secretion system baseplate subunit TssG n=1 Tax=Luteibacter sp. Sphag1AF TaxID=2587031 RepID=UPI00161F3D05|nr:type VI secretion system protein ImpH [Luteibacter sp. Sphag1AF]
MTGVIPDNRSFFGAVRAWERLRPDLPRVGTSTRPADDPVRFVPGLSLAFDPAEVRFPSRAAPFSTPHVEVTFFGLTGVNGPMPRHVSEEVLMRACLPDDPMPRLMDMLHHRLVCLLYRAWAQARPHGDINDPDVFAAALCALGGRATPMALPDIRLVYSDQRRSADALEQRLRSRFHVQARVIPFAGRWMARHRLDRLQLGGGRPARLGVDTLAGQRGWNIQHAFHLRLGPLPWPTYRRLLPDQPDGRDLARMVDSHVDGSMQWRASLCIEPGACPVMRLGDGYRLGHSAWLSGRARGGSKGFIYDSVRYAVARTHESDSSGKNS